MSNLNKIIDIATENKVDFMYKKGLIPTFIFLNEDTYETILEDKELYRISRKPINYNTILGLDVIIIKDNELNLKVGIK